MAVKQEPEGRSERLGEGLLKFEKLPASEVLYLLQTKASTTSTVCTNKTAAGSVSSSISSVIVEKFNIS